MSWFARGVQSAIFHYVSCAPCTGYMDRKHRRRDARLAKKAREKLQLEQPELYHHPEPTGTNPYWQEEIAMGPGPPPRRARRTNTGSTRAITIQDTHSAVVSHGGSSTDINQVDGTRLSDDTLDDDDNWNRKRYQREDEDLWGFTEPIIPLQPAVTGSSVGVGGISRPATARSGSYYSVRAPPVNDLHPPVVSLPSPHPADNRWMLQPPPKATVMAGKERARTRSRSGSGASSRVELSLQRQVSARHIQHKVERGETPELYPMSRGNSYNNLISGPRHDRPKTPQARPPSVASSRRKKRRDTAMTKTDIIDQSSGDSSDTVVKEKESPKTRPATHIKLLRIQSSRQELSTILSSGSGESNPTANDENDTPRHPTGNTRQRYSSTQSSDSVPYLLKRRPPLSSSDVSSLNALQELVSPRALLDSNFVSAPLIEAKIKLPPSDRDEEMTLSTKQEWNGSGFAVSRGWNTEQTNQPIRVPFDSLGVPERDPKLRWSVDF